ncbi:hypothetical protein, partial [Lacticaseibacillus pantheris]
YRTWILVWFCLCGGFCGAQLDYENRAEQGVQKLECNSLGTLKMPPTWMALITKHLLILAS